MVTATATRPIPQQAPVPSVQSVTWPPEAILLDANGQLLSRVGLLGPADGGVLLLGAIDDPGSLMRYYFGRGGREILLSQDDRAVHGWLDTHWEGDHRSWWLELED